MLRHVCVYAGDLEISKTNIFSESYIDDREF